MKIRWGILGAGKIAGKFAADFSEVHGGEIAAVASRSLDKARDFAGKYSIETSYAGYEKLIRDQSIDIIYIALPHTGHFEYTRKCLENGKHVLCEKPVTVNGKQFEQLVSLARAKKLFLMEAMWTYFLPVVKKVKEWIDAGEIGSIQLIHADFGYKAVFKPEGRLFNPQLAGGALLDIGIYPIAFSNLAAGSDVETIQGAGKIGSTGVDEYNAVTLTYKNGVISRLSSSLVNKLENRACIYGSKGRIVMDDFWMSKKAVLESGSKKETFIDERTTVGYNFEADEINRLLRDGAKESPRMPLEASRELLRIMDEVRSQIGLVYPCDSEF